MSKIYPNEFNGKKSEKIPYEKFKNLKENELIIYYSRNYIYRTFHNTLSDGEIADFFVIHPKKGIIFIECKKGIITYDRESGLWFTNNQQLKKDPIQQAMEHRRKFLKKIKDETTININIPTTHAVLFFETPKPEMLKKEFRFDIKPEMMMWREQFQDLDNSISKIFDLQESKNFINQQDLNKIHTLFMGQDLKNPLKNILNASESDQNLRLSENQEQILSAMFDMFNKKIAIRGLAGTGKTILLAQRAVDVVNERKRVLILTKTKPLNKFLKLLTKISDNRLTITHVDYFVRSVCKKYNEPYSHPRDAEDTDQHFEQYNPNICLDMFEKYPEEKYDLILVDEAQDFYKDWYEALCFAKKDDGQIVFFYDPFQEQINDSMISSLETAEDVTKYPLKINFRNTFEINNLLQKLIKNFYPDSKLFYDKPIENHGEKPQLLEVNDRNDQITKVTEIINKLVNKEKVIPRDIAVIYDGSIKAPSKNELSITTEIKKNGFDVISAEDYSEPYINKSKENCITLDSIRRFKGLEKTVIIVTNLEEITKETVKNLYTGLSRARAHLVIISNKKVINQIKDLN
jgi:hypothetical protein